MWNPVTITALIGAVTAAVVAVINALRTKGVANSAAKNAIANHVFTTHADTNQDPTDFESRVNPN